MKFIYKGKFSGDVSHIPCGEHRPGATKFREIEEPEKLARVANLAALGITMAAIVLYLLRLYFWPGTVSGAELGWQFILGAVLSFLVLIPHELLHALCFRREVYLYTYLRRGMVFVTGPEDMSKAWFILMSLCPNLVFGVLPYVLAIIWPSLGILAALGAVSLGSGAGDYYNVKNALTQMPRGARTYLHGFHSWWYIPEGVTPPEKKTGTKSEPEEPKTEEPKVEESKTEEPKVEETKAGKEKTGKPAQKPGQKKAPAKKPADSEKKPANSAKKPENSGKKTAQGGRSPLRARTKGKPAAEVPPGRRERRNEAFAENAGFEPGGNLHHPQYRRPDEV